MIIKITAALLREHTACISHLRLFYLCAAVALMLPPIHTYGVKLWKRDRMQPKGGRQREGEKFRKVQIYDLREVDHFNFAFLMKQRHTGENGETDLEI